TRLCQRPGVGRHGGGCARDHRRGPPLPQRSAVRRPAGAAAGNIQGTDGPTEADRGDFEERVCRSWRGCFELKRNGTAKSAKRAKSAKDAKKRTELVSLGGLGVLGALGG